MFFENDLVKRQIESLLHLATKILLGKDETSYVIENTDDLDYMDTLYKQIHAYIDEKNIGFGEDLIFDNFDENDNKFIELAIDFYKSVNEFTDEELEEANFEREEIKQGLCDFMRQCGINDIIIEN